MRINDWVLGGGGSNQIKSNQIYFWPNIAVIAMRVARMHGGYQIAAAERCYNVLLIEQLID